MISPASVPAFCAGVLFMTFSAMGQNTVLPFAYTPPSSQLPPVGLAASETAQVNVVNTAAQTNSGTAPSCTGTISFYSSSGSLIGSATSFTVGSGHIFSVTLPFASIGATGSRAVIRAAIALSSVIAQGSVLPPGPQSPCALAYSLETYDTSTGVTHSFVSGVTAPSLIGVIRPAVFAAPAP